MRKSTTTALLCALTSGACGGGSEQPDTAHSAAEELDWSFGAPAVEGHFAEEQKARLAVCVLVSRVGG